MPFLVAFSMYVESILMELILDKEGYWYVYKSRVHNFQAVEIGYKLKIIYAFEKDLNGLEVGT